MSIEVYCIKSCVWCKKAKSLLIKQGIKFSEINNVAALAKRMKLKSGGTLSVPQIFVNGRRIGGFTELRARAAAGKSPFNNNKTSKG
jgi:glutaredoxin 3